MEHTLDDVYMESEMLLQALETEFRRNFVDTIDWEERLVFIKGARGVGKSTLILQHIRETFGLKNHKALYISMDSLVVNNFTLYDIADYHYNHGGTHLFVDEVHKYHNWSQELKNIYDKIKKLKVVVSGSSLLEIYKGSYDLSRRAVTYVLPGLSLREYINIVEKTTLEPISFSDILENHIEIAVEITKKVNPLNAFKSYVSHGYYPFFLEGTRSFHNKLNNAINVAIENDMVQLCGIDATLISKIKKLIYQIGCSVPFKPNYSKLSAAMELNRQTVVQYVQYLHEANIFMLLWENAAVYGTLSKPEKIYLHNPNLCYLIPQPMVNIGNLRETFFMNQVSKLHKVFSSPVSDFLVNNKYTFEIGGQSKGYSQIAKLKNSYLLIDDKLVGSRNAIPLWMFGFLY